MEIEYGKLLRAVRRRWWVPIILALVLGLVAGLISASFPKTYTATTRALIVPANVSGFSMSGGNPNFLIDLGTSLTVLNQVIEDLELEVTYEELINDVLLIQQTGTSVILISVTGPDPEQAALISDSIAETLIAHSNALTMVELQNIRGNLEYRSNLVRDQIITIDARMRILLDSQEKDDSQMQAELDGLRTNRLDLARRKADMDASLREVDAQISNVHTDVIILEAAEVPIYADGLSPLLVAILGAFVGAAVGAVLVIVSAVRDKTVVSERQVVDITGAPVVRVVSPASATQGLDLVYRLMNGLDSSLSSAEPRVSLVAPTYLSIADHEAGGSEDGRGFFVNGTSRNEDAFAASIKSSGIVIVSQLGRTSEIDLSTTIGTLQMTNASVVGNIVIRHR